MILPLAEGSFVWRSFEGKPGLVCEPLETLAPHVFTTAEWPLGTRTSPALEADGWASVASAVGVDPRRLARVRQVHGVKVVVGAPDRDAPLPEADIIILRDVGTAAAVQVADCVPLLYADPATGAVAAVHAGWRGLSARAPQVAVSALVREFGARSTDLIVAMGPSIGACCYEVGPDVREAFAVSGFGRSAIERWFIDLPLALDANPTMETVRERARESNRWFFDGWSAARAQLVESGVTPGRIFGPDLCTASHVRLFCSYRRDGPPSGRMVGVIRCEGPRP